MAVCPGTSGLAGVESDVTITAPAHLALVSPPTVRVTGTVSHRDLTLSGHRIPAILTCVYEVDMMAIKMYFKYILMG